MGGSVTQNQQQTQTSTTAPWQPAGNTLVGILSKLDSLPNAPDRTGLASNAYGQFAQQLNPYLQSSFLDPRQTPGFGAALSALNSDITNQINGQFAAAGRDLSGANSQALARGLSQGEGQLLANQYNQNAANQLGAANALYGAGGQNAALLSQLDQTDLQRLAAATGIALGPAQAFGTTTGNTTGMTSNNVPIGQQIAGYAALAAGAAGSAAGRS
jgi:hypothetical protein